MLDTVPVVKVPCCGGVTTVNVSRSPAIGSVPVRVICTGAPEFVWIFSLLAVGLGEAGLLDSSTLSSVMPAKLLKLLPYTVILKNLPVVPPATVYFSKESVVPLLLPVKAFLKVLPSEETEIIKLCFNTFPRYQAIFTSQIFILDP